MSEVVRANELQELPLLALLAVGVRCARRVCALVRLANGHPEAAFCMQAVEAAVQMTEGLAAGREVDLDELAVAVEWAMRAVVFASEMHPPCEQAAYAANAAYAVISGAKALVEAVGAGDVTQASERVLEAV